MVLSKPIKRDWLIYSHISKRAYCWVCKLFTTSPHPPALAKDGTNDWKNISTKLSEHECSKGHFENEATKASRMFKAGRIDTELEKQIEGEAKYWTEVLKRVVSAIKFLSSRGLALRGDNQVLGDTQNGNFLGMLEFLAEWDAFMAEHIKRHCNKGRGMIEFNNLLRRIYFKLEICFVGHTNYTSSTICDELILLMSKNVLLQIILEVMEAKYFALIIDSTPDISHVDQLSIVVRLVTSCGEIRERFLGFVPISSHTAASMVDVVTKFFARIGLDLQDCRGQSYDNAANMSGIYNGLQAKIKEHSLTADFVPCAAHSLNLVGNFAAGVTVNSISFFGLVQKVYVFFSSSTHRWQTLQDRCESSGATFTVKKLCDTRWSARADATTQLTRDLPVCNHVLTWQESRCQQFLLEMVMKWQ